jgi:hypothetical protein
MGDDPYRIRVVYGNDEGEKLVNGIVERKDFPSCYDYESGEDHGLFKLRCDRGGNFVEGDYVGLRKVLLLNGCMEERTRRGIIFFKWGGTKGEGV